MSERYDRNIRIPGFGEAAQRALQEARVLVLGAGGLGAPAILYLAAAGIGTLAVADGDTVALSNLQRQILYGTDDIGKSKAACAALAIARLNPEVKAVGIAEHITPARMEALFPEYDCILDCVDSAASKQHINRVCVRLHKPFVHAGVSGLAGQLFSYAPGHACLGCAFPKTLPSFPGASVMGVMGAAAGTLGAMQAAEAIKMITGFGAPLYDTMLHVDLESGEILRAEVSHRTRCQVCGGA